MHRNDHELQALIDGELRMGDSERVVSHLAECERCRARHEALALAFRETGDLLSVLDHEAPALSADDVIRTAERRAIPRRGTPRHVMWAASIAGLLLAGAVVAAILPESPVRAIVERMVTGVETESAVQDSAPVDGWDRNAGVALVPRGALQIDFTTTQAEGSIELVDSDADTARVEVRSDSVGFVVGDGSIVVENRGAKASYRVSLPEGLPGVLIRIGDRTVYQRIGSELLRDESRPGRDTRRIDFRRIPSE